MLSGISIQSLLDPTSGRSRGCVAAARVCQPGQSELCLRGAIRLAQAQVKLSTVCLSLYRSVKKVFLVYFALLIVT